MGLSYEQLNPTETVRSILMDPTPALRDGFAWPQMFGADKVIDVGPRPNTPGLLSGTIDVRDPRNFTGAAAGQALYQGVGSPRETVTRFPDAGRNFSIKQVSGQAEELIKRLANAKDPELEMSYFMQAQHACWVKLERWCADFFLSKAGDTFAQTGFSVPGWSTLDWTGSGYTALGSAAYDTIGSLHAALETLTLAADGQSFDVAYIDRTGFAKLQRDHSILGRYITSIATANGSAVAVAGNQNFVLPGDGVKAVFREFLGLDLRVGKVVMTNQREDTTASQAYIGRTGRMWVGRGGNLGVAAQGTTQPVVHQMNSAYAMVRNGMPETDSGPTELVGAQRWRCTVDHFVDLMALKTTHGCTIYNLWS